MRYSFAFGPPLAGRAVGGHFAGASMRCIPAFAAAALLLAGCESAGQQALGTNVPLASASNLSGAATPGVRVWRSPELASYERTATAYEIPPATVYRGAGSEFSGLTPQQVDEIAANLTAEVRQQFSRRFRVVNAPGPGVFSIQLIIARIVPPHPIPITSGPYDFSATVIGMPNAQTTSSGEMTVSGRVTDASSGKLLAGFVAPVSPQSMGMDTTNSNDSLAFAKAASEQFASDLVAAVVRQRQLNRGAAGT